MEWDRHRELHQFVEERAGDAYRTAFYYDEDGWDAIYVRDDLATDRLREHVPETLETLRQREPLFSEAEYPSLGAVEGTTEVHDDGIVLHFPEGESSGTVVSLDRDAARRLTGFMLRCQAILEQSVSPGYQSQKATD